MNFRSLSLSAACALLAACQSAPKPAAAPEKWLRTELYFDIAPAEAEGLGLAAAEGTWRAFLDEEVAPRFPDGFTVLDGYGQERGGAPGPVERSRVRVLIVVHPAAAEKRGAIEAIRSVYKAKTGARTVLAAETPIAPPRF